MTSWIFDHLPEAPLEGAGGVTTLRHPEAAGRWSLDFDPPLPPHWHGLDWDSSPVGVIDARLILVLDDGSRLSQPFVKIGRNRCRALFRPVGPLRRIEVVLSGSALPESWPPPVLRAVSRWEQRWALVRRGFDVLKGDPRSLAWRTARFLIQVQRQGRTTIPLTTVTRSEAEAYALWRERFDERDEDHALHEARISRLAYRPSFTIIADPDVDPTQAKALADSLKAHIYGHWELFIPGGGSDVRMRPLPEGPSGASRINAALALATGAFTLLPGPGTKFRAHALLVFALTLQRHRDAHLVYADDDDLDPSGRRNPRFKPAWSPMRALSWDYIGDPCCFGTPTLRAVGGMIEAARTARRHDLLLKTTAGLKSGAIVHVAQILSHRTVLAHAPSTPEDLAVVRAYVDKPDDGSRVLADPRSPHPRVAHGTGSAPLDQRDHDVVRKPVPTFRHHALVSIIIPTRDRADLLRLSVGSIKAKTSYPRYEILIVDNGSREDETMRLFESWAGDPAIRVLKDPRPFNYAGLNNFAAARAGGAILALVNNDIEIIDAGWLDEMVGLALRPGTGCVGAKLYYPDGRLQHGGVVTGVGAAAGHRHKRAAPGAPGMLDCLVTVNEVSAVTGACLVVRKAIYDAVGGLDAETFAVGYNDVDFCLRVAAAGYSNLWTPFAELNHHESVSRGRDLSPATVERFNREVLALRLRWGERLLDDPYSSPNLTLDSEDGGIRVQ